MRDCDSSHGVPDILPTALERVHIAVRDRRGPEVITPLLNAAVSLCAEHFATEERVLRRYGFSHVHARAAMHALLLERTPGVRARLLAGEQDMTAVVDFLHSLLEEAGYGSAAHPGRSRSDHSRGVTTVLLKCVS